LAGCGVLLALSLVACGDDKDKRGVEAETTDGVAVPADLSPMIDNPYVAFASMRRAVYEGTEIDPDNGESIDVRVVAEPRRHPAVIAGTEATVVDVVDREDGAVIERTADFYAQADGGGVFYLGERVDDIDQGEVVGHHGAWEAGVDGAKAGVFMPAEPDPGDAFAQEHAPGVAEDRSTVVRTELTVRVPAGTFVGCIETEDVDPLSDAVERKFYCRGVGLVRERFPTGGSLDLVEFESRDYETSPR
jgi:hypothetical protein